MTLQKNAMALGLFLSLCISMFSQEAPAKRKVKGMTADTPVGVRAACPAKGTSYHIDLCALRRTMDNQRQEMEFKDLKGNSKWSGVHDDVILSFPAGDEVIWECNDPDVHVHHFSIDHITRIKHKLPGPNPRIGRPAEFPFCDDFRQKIGADLPGKTPAVFPGATKLHSGTAVKEAAGECYKYSFTVDGAPFDPHLIVTGGSPGGPVYKKDERMQCHFSTRARPRMHTPTPPKKQ